MLPGLVMLVGLGGVPAAPAAVPATPTSVPDVLTTTPRWVRALDARLAAIDAGDPEALGVYVLDLADGDAYGMRADEVWYVASGVKLPIAIALMRAVERGDVRLDETIELRAGDVVDGAGATNTHPPGTRLRVDWLLRQMLVRSDNTASDLLIRRVGLDRVNAVAATLSGERFGTITTLGDVRRRAYGGLHANAAQLTGDDLLALKRARGDRARYALLAQRLGVDPATFLAPDIGSAFAAYYASHLNSAPLSGYGAMLAALARGRALAPSSTAHLLRILARVQTGQARVRAGLPRDVVFAHKTGTQRERVCDFGVAWRRGAASKAGVVIAACVRGRSLAGSERLLREVGAAIAASGVLRVPRPATTARGDRR